MGYHGSRADLEAIISAARRRLLTDTHDDDKDLAAAIVHDLRSPLNACAMSLSLIELQAAQSPSVLRSAEVLRRNLDRQALLVKDLSDLLDAMTGGLRLDREELDLLEIIEAAAQTVAAGTGVAIGWAASRPPACLLHADAEKLGRAISIALERVAAGSPAGSRVEMTLTDGDAGIRLEVRGHEPAGATSAGQQKYPVMRQAAAKEIVAGHGGTLQMDHRSATLQLARE